MDATNVTEFSSLQAVPAFAKTVVGSRPVSEGHPVQKFYTYLRGHLRQDFHAGYYASVLGFLALAMWLNYHYQLKVRYLDPLPDWGGFFGYCLLYGGSYGITWLLHRLWLGRVPELGSRAFWIKSLFIIGILALDGSTTLLPDLVRPLLPPALSRWGYSVAINLAGWVVVALPLLVFYKLYEPGTSGFYGLRPKHLDLRPYLWLLVLMLPLIAFASFQPSFLAQYPQYNPRLGNTVETSAWLLALVYELAYGADFINVELVFRGFLVLSLGAVVGRRAVVPMAAVYCCLHFGKPAGEAISSIFGGYILGVITYETRSLWGGIMVHVGIAWLMELAAAVQKGV